MDERAQRFAIRFLHHLSEVTTTFTPMTHQEMLEVNQCLSDTQELGQEMKQTTQNW